MWLKFFDEWVGSWGEVLALWLFNTKPGANLLASILMCIFILP